MENKLTFVNRKNKKMLFFSKLQKKLKQDTQDLVFKRLFEHNI